MMKALMISAAALAFATPAIAAPATTPATDAAAATSAPAPAVAEEVAPAQSATPAETAAAAAAPTDPAAILKTEFPAYDKDKSGELSQVEFSSWMNALKAANPQKVTMTPAQETAWLSESFSKADADKTKSVTLAELTSFLTQQS